MPAGMYVTRDEVIGKIVRAAYPDYRGRTIQVAVTGGTLDLASYWEGGSRNYFVFVRFADLKAVPMPEQGPYDRPVAGADKYQMRPGIAVVKHTLFQGKDLGITIYVHPENVNPTALPAPDTSSELSWAEVVVLVATTSYKSSYAGVKDYRFSEATRTVGITRAEWDAAKASLQAKRLLDGRGALTMDGKNAVATARKARGGMDLFYFKRQNPRRLSRR